MEVWEMTALMIAGCFAGFINVMAGGGSLLTLPIMVFMGLPGPVANGTNRVAIEAQNVSAVVGFFRKVFSDFNVFLTLVQSRSLGAAVGAYLGTKLDGVWFNKVLACVMVAIITRSVLPTLKHRCVPKCVPAMYVWSSFGLRLCFGRCHKSFIYSYKRLLHKYLQNPISDCRSEG